MVDSDIRCAYCDQSIVWVQESNWSPTWKHENNEIPCTSSWAPVPLEAGWAHSVLFGELGFCGCGVPESVTDLIRDVLDLCPLYDSRDKIQNVLPNNGIEHFVLYSLDRVELIEHGSSIGGSWLTEKGLRFRDALHTFTFDQISEGGCLPDGQELEKEI